MTNSTVIVKNKNIRRDIVIKMQYYKRVVGNNEPFNLLYQKFPASYLVVLSLLSQLESVFK